MHTSVQVLIISDIIDYRFYDFDSGDFFFIVTSKALKAHV